LLAHLTLSTGDVAWIHHWHLGSKAGHCHELLLVLSLCCLICSTCDRQHTRHCLSHWVLHHWEATHGSLTGRRLAVCCTRSRGASGRTTSSGCLRHHLLLHGHLLGKHRLILLVHLLMNGHLLIDELLLLQIDLLQLGRALLRSICVGFVSCWCGSAHWRHHWRHHGWHSLGSHKTTHHWILDEWTLSWVLVCFLLLFGRCSMLFLFLLLGFKCFCLSIFFISFLLLGQLLFSFR